MPYFTGESILRRLNETNVYNKHRQCYIFTWVKKIMWDATIMLTITRCFENWLMTFYLTLYNFQTCLSEVALAKNQWCFLVECFKDSFISTSMLRWYSFFLFLFNRSKIDLSHQMSHTRQLRDYRGYMRAYYYHSMKQDRKTYVTSHYRENNRRYWLFLSRSLLSRDLKIYCQWC